MPIRKGDIVRVKPGFDQTLTALAARRAGLPLRENSLYQVLDCELGEIDIVLNLIEVRVFRVGGVRHVVKIGAGPFPYVSKQFEVAYAG